MPEEQKNNIPAAQANPPSQATPASNQNLIVGIVLSTAVLLLLLLVITQQSDGSKSSSDSDDITKLKQEIEDARRANAAERASRGLANGQSAEALSAKIKQDVDQLSGLLASQQNRLTELDDSKATVRSLNRQVTELQDQLATSKNEITRLQEELSKHR